MGGGGGFMLEPQCLKPSSKVFPESVDSFWLPYPWLEMRHVPAQKGAHNKEVLASASFFLQVDPEVALRTNAELILIVKVH